MNAKELIESGLLELYVLGDVSSEQNALVEKFAASDVDVKRELSQIENAFKFYAMAYAIGAPPSLKDKVLDKIRATNSSSSSQTSNFNPSTNKSGQQPKTSALSWLLALSCLALISAFFFNNNSFNKFKTQHNKAITECDSTAQMQNQKIQLLQSVLDVDNTIIKVAPTEKFPETDLIFYTNPSKKSNYLQIKNLPNIAKNQSFQLWSLKGDEAPIPLDVFQGDGELIIPVGHVDGTNAYAITIEPLGGQDAPTLSNLIGVFSVPS